MSIIHVNQIKTHVERLFRPHIDMMDCASAPTEQELNHFLSRALAAYAVHFLSGAELKDAAGAVVDSGKDNGIDAVLYHEATKRLYVIQSKWIHSGNGEPENGAIKKFVSGVRDLFNLRLDRFNAKVQAKQSVLAAALADPATRYEIVVVHTGASRLAQPSQTDLDDLAAEMNDVSEVLFATILNQSELHASLAAGIAGEPINIQIGLKSWGRKEDPKEAFYGQLSADQIAIWWAKYRYRLFSKNLRSVLGDTDVNSEMRETLQKQPAEFWYFNNGITIVCRRATKAMAGGGGNDFATFHCEDVSIVNGAQTAGSIGKFSEGGPTGLADIMIPLRIIVREDDDHFGQQVTKTNNRQNRIENRDFVSLDEEQNRIRTELAIDKVDYQVVRSETVSKGENAFDLVEATTALACASGHVRLVVQLKREIGKLWEDLSKAPYKELFNPSVPGLYVWRCVQVQRMIDKALDTHYKRTGIFIYYSVRIHGNRIISKLAFAGLPLQKLKDPLFDFTGTITQPMVDAIVDQKTQALGSLVDKYYQNAIIPTLFKNLKKCEHLARESILI
jgi:hypothetical protein